ncbi:uncharacterized protein CLUP02_01281 [Colletotrichum lupini]|uniref:Uncharacterized protein n=1 Tax=Colletotrichum lupini TaxID=145971 RepID=A0A9Q8W9S5_9PEZI|nr:uncharacterized protein CLUP02_01281 [Colletotrichum lupini]UQC74630.1 hypothetical protein CLUP02_01281 [Colletotrichum lupini]
MENAFSVPQTPQTRSQESVPGLFSVTSRFSERRQKDAMATSPHGCRSTRTLISTRASISPFLAFSTRSLVLSWLFPNSPR